MADGDDLDAALRDSVSTAYFNPPTAQLKPKAVERGERRRRQPSYAVGSKIVHVRANVTTTPVYKELCDLLEGSPGVRLEIHPDLSPDYRPSATSCAVVASLQYLKQKPSYLYERMAEVGTDFGLRVVLVWDDVRSDGSKALTDVQKACVSNDFTLILGWSPREIARYLKQMCVLQNEHSFEGISDPSSSHERVLTSVRRVNKTDVVTLKNSFSTFAEIAEADEEEFLGLARFGEIKARELRQAFELPFYVE